MFGLRGNPFSDGFFSGYIRQSFLLVIAGVFLSTPLFRKLKEKTEGSTLAAYGRAAGLFVVFVLSIAALVSNSYNPFIYFNF